MKKLLLLICMLSVGVIYAQEIPDTQVKKKKGYRPHSISISQRLGGFAEVKNRISGGQAGDGITISDGSEYSHYGNATTVFEFYTQKRKGRSQYTPMISIRLSAPFSSNPSALYGGFRWGFSFGGSQYLFDLRSKETGLGWSMLANGGFIIDFPTIEEMTSLIYPAIIGGEVDFKAIYNFKKSVGITFGLNMGYQFSMELSSISDLLGTSKPEGGSFPEIAIVNGFSWNLNFGIMF